MWAQIRRIFECSDADWSWISLITFNFSWSDSKTHNFSLKNKISSIDLNFLSNISSYDFLFFSKTFRISLHVKSFWLAILTRSNRNKFESEFFSVSFNSWIIRESIFSNDKIVWCMCLFRSSDSSIDRSSKRLVNESALSFFFFDW
jgi:hypothetical protein